MFENVKAVLIDIDDTVLDFHKCAASAIRKASTRGSVPLPDKVFERFFVLNRGLWDRLQAGEFDLAGLRKIRWNVIFADLGVEADGERFEVFFERALEESAEPVEGARDLLAYLSSRYRLYAASNAPSGQQEGRLKRAGLLEYFDGVFVSGDLGASKPDPVFFDRLFERLPGLRREECVMLGDSVSADVAGAKAAGLRTLWLDRAGRGGPSGADAEAKTPDEVKKYL